MITINFSIQAHADLKGPMADILGINNILILASLY